MVMDLEKAKFVLSCYRPDGGDAHDESFVEALALVAENRELSDWFAKERSMDSTFSQAMCSLEVPSELRGDILASMTPDLSSADDPKVDTAFIYAMHEITPPAGLRQQILTAMEQETKVVKGGFPIWKLLPIAAAAVLAVSVFIIFNQSENPQTSIVQGKKSSVFSVQVEAVEQMRNTDIQLVTNSIHDSMDWLNARQLPTTDIPASLQDMTCLGVSEFAVSGGGKGSIVRFESDAGDKINMLVLAKDDVTNVDKLTEIDNASEKDVAFCSACKYWVGRMKQKDTVVLILSDLNKELVTGLVQSDERVSR